ncbi:hypothetical protein JAAARDRAFT_337179 [Jaapia argillacea MUCL 33604]|uniref:Uncharacterized protein n=1 Tax=Jaapia argillacea MUCL 33604 TaxID=933084 RepID=A0A067PW34_9AGAM|nr:hypothetical protein JAAARDRAFT_337179 [Jaapia argillacea MUCL 33604]
MRRIFPMYLPIALSAPVLFHLQHDFPRLLPRTSSAALGNALKDLVLACELLHAGASASRGLRYSDCFRRQTFHPIPPRSTYSPPSVTGAYYGTPYMAWDVAFCPREHIVMEFSFLRLGLSASDLLDGLGHLRTHPYGGQLSATLSHPFQSPHGLGSSMLSS